MGTFTAVTALEPTGPARRPMQDLPEGIAAHATEHRLHRPRCRCGDTATAPAPAETPASLQYGHGRPP